MCLPPQGEHFRSRRTRPSSGGHGQREATAGWPWRVDRQHGSRTLKILMNIQQLITELKPLISLYKSNTNITIIITSIYIN